jgi:two-component system response regulator FixJ
LHDGLHVRLGGDMTLSKHVYVVDDDSMVRSSTGYFLDSSGYAARMWDSGQAFLDDMAGLSPGCVLLDVRMPQIDGLQVIELMHDRLAQLPVIIMTGHGDIATAVHAMKLGASDFHEKPFDEATLIETLDRLFAALDKQVEADDQRADAAQRLKQLTKREVDILQGLAEGLPNKVLAYRLGLSVRTVEMHRSNMMIHLGVRSLPEALRLAFLAGVVALDAGDAGGV